MPNTTNFNFPTPADTDLVKDGASAIRSLGNSIDTAFVDLKGGTTGQVLSKASNTDMDFTWVAQDDSNAIQNAIVDAKGDLITATAADTPARLAVGTNNQVLMADSTTATGLKWATPASGSYTSLATGSMNTSTNLITISSIDQTYLHLFIVVDKPTSSIADRLQLRVNGVTSNYTTSGMVSNSATGNATTQSGASFTANQVSMVTTASTQSYFAFIYNYTLTSFKPILLYASSNLDAFQSFAYANTSAAITSISLQVQDPTRTFTGGTYTLYGVK